MGRLWRNKRCLSGYRWNYQHPGPIRCELDTGAFSNLQELWFEALPRHHTRICRFVQRQGRLGLLHWNWRPGRLVSGFDHEQGLSSDIRVGAERHVPIGELGEPHDRRWGNTYNVASMAVPNVGQATTIVTTFNMGSPSGSIGSAVISVDRGGSGGVDRSKYSDTTGRRGTMKSSRRFPGVGAAPSRRGHGPEYRPIHERLEHICNSRFGRSSRREWAMLDSQAWRTRFRLRLRSSDSRAGEKRVDAERVYPLFFATFRSKASLSPNSANSTSGFSAASERVNHAGKSVEPTASGVSAPPVTLPR